VCRFYESVKDKAADGTKQVKWYDEGVGTKWYDRFIGGAIGAGLELNIVQGYEYLAQQYEAGDEVYVLGFSRGAYTARSLVGMIRNCGLIYPKHVDATCRHGLRHLSNPRRQRRFIYRKDFFARRLVARSKSSSSGFGIPSAPSAFRSLF